MYRTGYCAGNNGPVYFLIKVGKKDSGFNEKFIESQGCEKG